MQFLWAFIVGGLICVVGQLLMDGVKLTPAHDEYTRCGRGGCGCARMV